MKKIENMDIKREEYEKIKENNLLAKRKLREQRYCSCLNNRRKLQKLWSEKRLDILLYQSAVLNRSLTRDSKLRKKDKKQMKKR